MEGRGCFHEGYLHVGTTQLLPEKQVRAGGDNFIVDELLDFSDEKNDVAWMSFSEDGGSEDAGENFSGDSCANSSLAGRSGGSFSGELICLGLNDAGFSGDLCEPHEERAELQWLSNFVEESFSSEEINKQQIVISSQSASTQPTHEACAYSSIAGDQPPSFVNDTPVPGKIRSKRSRIAPRNWTSRLHFLPLSSSTSSPESSPIAIQPNVVKKRGKKKEGSQDPLTRVCLHCGSDKTPQWRTGPTGPKTLCNACGVRFKSGRLVPEYRPAASPTFVLSKHSNSHRKVLELRRKKGIQPSPHFLPVYTSAVTAATEAPTAARYDNLRS